MLPSRSNSCYTRSSRGDSVGSEKKALIELSPNAWKVFPLPRPRHYLSGKHMAGATGKDSWLREMKI